MTATPDCQPWCTDHQDNGFGCYTHYAIFDKEKSNPDSAPLSAEVSTLAGQFNAFRRPVDPNIAWIEFHKMLSEEDEEPHMEICFHPAGEQDEPSATLIMDIDELKELHANIGAIIKNFS